MKKILVYAVLAAFVLGPALQTVDARPAVHAKGGQAVKASHKHKKKRKKHHRKHHRRVHKNGSRRVNI